MLHLSLIVYLITRITISFIQFKKTNESEKEKVETKNTVEDRAQLILSTDKIVDKINDIIEDIIRNAIDLYRVQTPSLNGNYQYITSKEIEEQLLPYVYFTVMKSMTPDIVNLLSIIYYFKPFNIEEFLSKTNLDNYKPDNSDTSTLEWIIFTKVNLAVTNYANKINM
jgi:uncharacterized protein (UPF0333 family)